MKNNKTLLIFIVSALVLVIAVGVSYGVKKKERNSITPPSGPVSDWLTYKNEKYGYTVKYPRDWYLDNGPGDVESSFSLISFPREKYYHGGIVPTGGAEIVIIVDAKKFNAPVTVLLDEELKGREITQVSSSTVIINGERGHKRIYFYEIGPGTYYKKIVVYLPKNNLLYKFFLSYRKSDSQEEKFLQTFDQIVKTFSFIDRTTESGSRR